MGYMSELRCTEIVSDAATRCNAVAAWTYLLNGSLVARGYACNAHVTAAEARTPAATFLPLDSENHNG